MTLDDGRTLSWYEYGDPTGRPCLFLPGVGTSGRAGITLDAAATADGIRLLSVNRPGLGHSDPAPARRVADWAGDVEQWADHLGLDRFGLIGHSAGAAYALAVAHRLPDRVHGTMVGAGSPPYSEEWTRADGMMSRVSRLYYGLALRAPRLFGALYHLSTPRSVKAVDRLMALATRGTSPDAQFARAYPDETRASLEALADGCRQGSAGPTQDIVLLCRPWGFDLLDVTGPVEWWHGEQDGNVSPRSGREMTSRLPQVTTHFVDGGHYVLFAHAREVMAALRRTSDHGGRD
ncbi:alpha/beta hydrolase [Streptosporangium subroseum]|uniref:alpha/beta fold hydrolase n=1 Tax=Streptosporangium subroseum TaxID=106412 RepID=UPI0034281DD8